jgi:thiol-disulfide isomerase/thioredoxin
MKLIIWFLLPFACTGQAPLKVGDAVPGIEWNETVHYKSPEIKMNDFKDRLVLIDFWATWCTACLQEFPKLESLQNEFGEKIQLLLVASKENGDNRIKVSKYFDKHKHPDGTDYKLPSVCDDSIAARLFPHRLLPHCVCIYKGKVKAITGPDEVNRELVQSIIDGKEIKLPMKNDLDPETLMAGHHLPLDRVAHYSFFVKGELTGYPCETLTEMIEGTECGKLILNTPLLDIYSDVARKINKELSRTSIIVEKNAEDLKFPVTGFVKGSPGSLCSYSIYVNPLFSASLWGRMLDDLNLYSGYYGRFERRKCTRFVLGFSHPLDSIVHQHVNGEQREFKSLRELILFLDSTFLFNNPIIAGQSFRFHPVKLPARCNNAETMLKCLSAEGIALEKKDVFQDFFIIGKLGTSD